MECFVNLYWVRLRECGHFYNFYCSEPLYRFNPDVVLGVYVARISPSATLEYLFKNWTILSC